MYEVVPNPDTEVTAAVPIVVVVKGGSARINIRYMNAT